MATYYNNGNVNVQELDRSILNVGGGKNVTSKPGGVTHVTVYARSCDWHLSYDIQPDGTITNVHSTKEGRPTYDYKGAID